MAARILTERLTGRWKQPIVIENRPGADGLIGVAAFAATQDNHVLMFSPAAAVSVYPVVRERVPYDPIRDLIPIVSATDSFGSVSAPASSNIASLAHLVSQARAQPGKLNAYAVPGAFPYLLAGFLRSERLDMVRVSYREQNLAVQDLGEGRLDLMLGTLASILPVIQAGKVNVLAVTNGKRSPTLSQVQTVIEAGYPELEFEGFQGFFGSRGMSNELRDQIAADVAVVTRDPEVVGRLTAIGQVARATTPAEFSSMIERQRAKMEEIVERTGRF